MANRLTALRHALCFGRVLSRYGKRYRVDLKMNHLRVLFIISQFGISPSRYDILKKLGKKSSLEMNYSQLNGVLNFLDEEGLITERMRSNVKVFNLSPSGTVTLIRLEKWTRRYKMDYSRIPS